ALVKGQVRQESGTLESRLVEDRSLRVRATSGREGKAAVTRYRVLGRGADTTLLELSLGTGRRRQIRVQLAGMGHPIVGDREHGGPAGECARAGADVVICSRKKENLEPVVEEIKKLGRRSFCEAVDVRQEDAVKALVERTAKEMGRVDVMVNNAGASFRSKVEDI